MSAEGTTGGASRAEEWVRRIAAGDVSAESEFVHNYLPGVRTLVRRHARPLEPDVDDMIQDVLKSALVALRQGRLRDASTLPAYLRGTVDLIVRAHYRKQHRRGEDHMDALDENLPADDDPGQNLIDLQRTALVQRLIGELGVDRDRELLRRFYLQGQSKEQVCAELGIASDHFHRVAFRARERLRELLEQAGVVDHE